VYGVHLSRLEEWAGAEEGLHGRPAHQFCASHGNPGLAQTLMVLVKDQYFVYKQKYSTIATLVEE